MNMIKFPFFFFFFYFCKQLIKNPTVNLFFNGALDNFSLIPKFVFKKVEIFISLEVYTYVVTAC